MYYKGKFVPYNLVKHHEKFKVIGKNLFVIEKKPAGDVEALMKDPRELRVVAKEVGLSMTLGDLVKAAIKPKYRKPTKEEEYEYQRLQKRLTDWCTKRDIANEIRRKKEDDKAVLAACAVLRKHGYMSRRDFEDMLPGYMMERLYASKTAKDVPTVASMDVPTQVR